MTLESWIRRCHLSGVAALVLACSPAPAPLLPAPVEKVGLVSLRTSMGSHWANGSLADPDFQWRAAPLAAMVTAVDVSRDGLTAVVTTGNADGPRVLLFDGQRTVGEVHGIGPTNPLAAFGRDQTLLMAAQEPTSVRVVSIRNGAIEELRSIRLGRESPRLIAVSSSGLRGVFLFPSSGQLLPFIWNPATQQYMLGDMFEVPAFKLFPGAVDVSDATMALVANGDLKLFRWSHASLEPIDCQPGRAAGVAVTKSGTAVAIKGGFNLALIDPETCSTTTIETDGRLSVPRTGCGPDGREVVAVLRTSDRQLSWAYLDELEERRFHTIPFGFAEFIEGRREVEVFDFAVSPCPD